MKVTLNLLPEEQKEKLFKVKLFRMTMQQVAYVLSLFVLVAAILLSVNRILSIQVRSIDETRMFEMSQERYRELQKYEELFEKTNGHITSVHAVQTHHLQWSHIFSVLSDSLTDGIVVARVATSDNQLSVSGTASTRDILLAFKETLSAVQKNGEPCFANVEIPNDDIFAKENIDFVITFELQKECMQP